LTIWHDEAQLQHRYGHRASTVLNGHRAKLLLSGQADPASLELASKLVGDEAVLQTSETTGGDGRASMTESVGYRRLLPPEALRLPTEGQVSPCGRRRTWPGGLSSMAYQQAPKGGRR
jgi:type IV secretory pathway TraG/TraD family ATPase VirD4